MSSTRPEAPFPIAPPPPPAQRPDPARSILPLGQQAPAWVQLAAVVLGVGPLYAIVFLNGIGTQAKGHLNISFQELAIGVAGMAMFGAFLLALLYLLGERPVQLQLRPGTILTDLGKATLTLCAMFAFALIAGIAALMLQHFNMLPREPGGVPEPMLDLAKLASKNSLISAFFFLAVIWLQAAVIEELTRVFVLSRLWKVWPAANAKLLAVIVWSVVFGTAHAYEGVRGMVGAGALGLALGLSYLLWGRVLPLVLAHGVYDTSAMLLLIWVSKHPEVVDAAKSLQKH